MFPIKISLLVLALTLLFFSSFTYASRGWGYPGYGGIYSGGYGRSFYWGGPSTYYDPSARGGSLGGPSHMGGGLSGGK